MRLVVDACSWINLDHGKDALPIVFGLQGFEWNVGPLVVEECSGLLTLAQAIEGSTVKLLDDATIGSKAFATLRDRYRLGPGETECIAFARELDLAVCTDDGRARDAVISELGKDRLIGTIGLLKRAVGDGLTTSLAAFQMYERMVAQGAFLPQLTENDFM